MSNTQSQMPILPLWQPRIIPPDTNQPDTNQPVPTLDSWTSLSFRSGPWRLLAADAMLVLKLLPYLPRIILPLRTKNTHSELYLRWANMRDIGLHAALLLLELIWLILVIPIFLVAPGLLSVAFTLFILALSALFFVLLRRAPTTVESRIQQVKGKEAEQWVFINGIMTGNHWIQENVDMLSEIFGRPVTGLHNRTYGLVFDLIECLIQRCFLYATKDTRSVYDDIKKILLKDNIQKYVFIAHSQGAIILSAVLDSLFADMPSERLEKIEIYTFGGAADHFNNPFRLVSSCQQGTSQSTPIPHAPEKPLLKHIEHYCNENDFVARFGTMKFTGTKSKNPFAGQVFVNKGHNGHLLNQHYLDRMFTDNNSNFQDMETEVEEDIAVQAVEEEKGGQVVEVAPISRRPAGTQRGMAARDISRLWKYKDGGSPD